MLEKQLVTVNKNMKKNIKIILFFVSIFLIGIGVWYSTSFNKEQVQDSNIIQTSTSTKSLLNDDQIRPIQNQMVVAKNMTQADCDKMIDQEKIDCKIRLTGETAAIKKDPRLCLTINDYQKRNLCILDIVSFSQDEEQCKRIADSSYRERCEDGMGMEFEGVKYCDKYDDDPGEKQECRDRTVAMEAAKKGDIQICSGLKTLEYSFLCEVNAMKKTGKGCDELQDKTKRNICISRVKFSKIQSQQDCAAISEEAYRKVCDAIFNNTNPDYKVDDDGDGLNSFKELWINTDPFKADTDGDGLSDSAEYDVQRTDPLNPDADGDGVSDGDEVKKGTNPKAPNKPGVVNPVDTDEDGLLNVDEVSWGTSAINPDTDGDGVRDGKEVENGTDPFGKGWQQDSDKDGLIDVDEIFYGTNQLKSDTDGDGVSDGDEIKKGKNPLGKGLMDFDQDGLSDVEELKHGTNSALKDTNGDVIDDYMSLQKNIDPINLDIDNDGLSNVFELKIKTSPFIKDTDNDGLSDFEEVEKYHTNPLKMDSDDDGYGDDVELKKGFDPLIKNSKNK